MTSRRLFSFRALSCAALVIAALSGTATRAESLVCQWKRPVRWGDGAPLRVRDLALPLVRWVGEAQGSEWSGARVTGQLQQRDAGFVFVGTWESAELVLDAEVDASDDAPFFTTSDVTLGGVGVLPRGSAVSVVSKQGGRVLVRPANAALSGFTPDEAPLGSLTCGELSISRYGPPGEFPQVPGFDSAAPRVSLDTKKPVLVFNQPGGARVGALTSLTDLVARQVETREGWTRVLLQHRTGVAWHGWVQQVPSPYAPPPVLGFLGRTRPARDDWKACEEEQPLFALAKGKPVSVGRVKPSTPFRVQAAERGHARVEFYSDTLRPVQGGTFLLGASAAKCNSWREAPSIDVGLIGTSGVGRLGEASVDGGSRSFGSLEMQRP